MRATPVRRKALSFSVRHPLPILLIDPPLGPSRTSSTLRERTDQQKVRIEPPDGSSARCREMIRSVFPDAEIGLEIAADKAIFRNLFSPLTDNLLNSNFLRDFTNITKIDLYVCIFVFHYFQLNKFQTIIECTECIRR